MLKYQEYIAYSYSVCLEFFIKFQRIEFDLLLYCTVLPYASCIDTISLTISNNDAICIVR